MLVLFFFLHSISWLGKVHLDVSSILLWFLLFSSANVVYTNTHHFESLSILLDSLFEKKICKSIYVVIDVLTEIAMPSPQYYLDVKDTDICTLDTKTSMATALEMGSTEIVLKDRSILFLVRVLLFVNFVDRKHLYVNNNDKYNNGYFEMHILKSSKPFTRS